MAKFLVEINCDTPAFKGKGLGINLSDVLNKLSKTSSHWIKGYGNTERIHLRDINGKLVGHAEYREDEG